MADQQGIDVDEVDFDFQLEEPEPIDEFAKGGRVEYRYGGDTMDGPNDKSANQQSASDTGPGGGATDTGPSYTGDSIGPSTPQEITIGDVPQVFDINTVGDPSQNPGSDNVKGGINYTPSFDPNYTTGYTPPNFFEKTIAKGKKAYNNPFVRLGLGMFLPTEFARLQQLIGLKNIYDRFSGEEEIRNIIEGGINPEIKLYKKGGIVGLHI